MNIEIDYHAHMLCYGYVNKIIYLWFWTEVVDVEPLNFSSSLTAVHSQNQIADFFTYHMHVYVCEQSNYIPPVE